MSEREGRKRELEWQPRRAWKFNVRNKYCLWRRSFRVAIKEGENDGWRPSERERRKRESLEEGRKGGRRRRIIVMIMMIVITKATMLVGEIMIIVR